MCETVAACYPILAIRAKGYPILAIRAKDCVIDAERLAGTRILIVEDEFYIASEVRSALADVGAEVLGPVATVAEADAFIEADHHINSVLLDVNLHGEISFGVADRLEARGIPFAFVTGYDRAALPERFSAIMSFQKPVRIGELVKLLGTFAVSERPRV